MPHIPQVAPSRRLAALLALAAVAIGFLFTLTAGPPAAHAASIERVNWVKSGDFRTVATLWNTTATGIFQCPAGAKIRVRYGGGWFAVNRQNQTLDCQAARRLNVGKWSLVVARMQVKVPVSQYVGWTYVVEGPS